MIKSLKLVVIFLMFSFETLSQGCSDAGFCTMGAMRPNQIYSKKINLKLKELELNFYRGKSTLSPIIYATTVDFTFGINDKTSFQFKLPYQWVTGNLGDTQGLGDISLSFTRNVYSTDGFHINATLGGKIPTGNSSVSEGADEEFVSIQGEADLPMYYQPSLGSWDIVAGAAFISRKWMLATGIQIPLTANENDFRYVEWEDYPSENYLMDHPLATDLLRGIDLMFRVERTFIFYNKVDLRIGLLPIYRITRDERTNLETGERELVDGTRGLALTGIGSLAYHFNTTHTIRTLYGMKILVRDVNPDGLTRDSIFSLAYVIRF